MCPGTSSPRTGGRCGPSDHRGDGADQAIPGASPAPFLGSADTRCASWPHPSATSYIIDYGAMPDAPPRPRRPSLRPSPPPPRPAAVQSMYPRGFFFGPIHLQSHFTLHLDAGAQSRLQPEPAIIPRPHALEGVRATVVSPQISARFWRAWRSWEGRHLTGRAGPGGRCGGKPAHFPMSVDRSSGLPDVLIEGITLKNCPVGRLTPLPRECDYWMS